MKTFCKGWPEQGTLNAAEVGRETQLFEDWSILLQPKSMHYLTAD